MRLILQPREEQRLSRLLADVQNGAPGDDKNAELRAFLMRWGQAVAEFTRDDLVELGQVTLGAQELGRRLLRP